MNFRFHAFIVIWSSTCSGLILSFLLHAVSERNLQDFQALTLAFARASSALTSHSLGSTKDTKETTLGPGCASTGEQISEISYFRSFSSLVSIGRHLLLSATVRRSYHSASYYTGKFWVMAPPTTQMYTIELNMWLDLRRTKLFFRLKKASIWRASATQRCKTLERLPARCCTSGY